MNTADLNRRIESLIRLGTIAEVDHAARKLRVKTGGLLTNWLAWPAEVGRNFRRWRPLRIGTQVVLGCPSGDPAQAVILQILYTSALDAPSTDPDVDLVQFEDGSYIEHNASNGKLQVHAAGDLHLTADGNIVINGSRVALN
jgi:phage baseplate assembly protein V